jgi:hypothetical protein
VFRAKAAIAPLWRLVVRSVGSGRGLSDGGSAVKGLETEKLALPFDDYAVAP